MSFGTFWSNVCNFLKVMVLDNQLLHSWKIFQPDQVIPLTKLYPKTKFLIWQMWLDTHFHIPICHQLVLSFLVVQESSATDLCDLELNVRHLYL